MEREFMKNRPQMDLSVVVPVFNESGSVLSLANSINDICSKKNLKFEIIFINDGSTDNTLNILKKINFIKIINFRKNFGQTSALDAGIKFSRGDYIVTMDGDGQNDPNDIPLLFKKIKERGLDVVSGWRKNRKDSFSKKLSSKLAAWLRKLLINDGIHDSGCTLKIYKQECFQNIDLSGELHRFIPAILKIKGFKIGEMVVKHHPRVTGKTKYTWKRGVKGGLDMFSLWFWKKYASRPLHLFGSIGLLLVLISFIAGSWAIYLKLLNGQDLSETVLTDLSLFSFLMGIQFFVFGLMSDMISKSYFATTRDKIYDIKEVIDNTDD